MKNFVNASDLLDSVRSISEQVHRRKLDRRTSVIVSPTFLDKHFTDLIIPWKKDEELVALAVAHYYFSEVWKFYFHLALEQSALKGTGLEVLLESESIMQSWLMLNDKYHSRSFFGNIYNVNKLEKLVSRCFFPRKVENVKETIRKRGYDDKGSLRPKHQWKPSSDWTLTELQAEIEAERQAHSDTLLFMKGFLE